MKFDTDDDSTDLEDDIVIPLLTDTDSITCDDLSSGDNGKSNDTEDGEDTDATPNIVLTESCYYFKEANSIDAIDSESTSSDNDHDHGCILVYDTSEMMFKCSCRHNTTFAVTSIFEIETNNNVVGMIVYYAILGGFTLIRIICVIFMFCVNN